MSPAQQAEVDRMIEAGQTVSVGVLPDLDPYAAYFADLWCDLRASTPGDQPISLPSLALMVGDDLHRVLPVMQTMDRALFDFQAKRLEAERKQAEQRAKARRRR